MALARRRASRTDQFTLYACANIPANGQNNLIWDTRLLDCGKPAAVMLISILRLVLDEDDPHAMVTRLMEAMPSGSWLALSHPVRDIHTQQLTGAASRFNQLSPA